MQYQFIKWGALTALSLAGLAVVGLWLAKLITTAIVWGAAALVCAAGVAVLRMKG